MNEPRGLPASTKASPSTRSARSSVPTRAQRFVSESGKTSSDTIGFYVERAVMAVREDKAPHHGPRGDDHVVTIEIDWPARFEAEGVLGLCGQHDNRLRRTIGCEREGASPRDSRGEAEGECMPLEGTISPLPRRSVDPRSKRLPPTLLKRPRLPLSQVFHRTELHQRTSYMMPRHHWLPCAGFSRYSVIAKPESLATARGLSDSASRFGSTAPVRSHARRSQPRDASASTTRPGCSGSPWGCRMYTSAGDSRPHWLSGLLCV